MGNKLNNSNTQKFAKQPRQPMLVNDKKQIEVHEPYKGRIYALFFLLGIQFSTKHCLFLSLCIHDPVPCWEKKGGNELRTKTLIPRKFVELIIVAIRRSNQILHSASKPMGLAEL